MGFARTVEMYTKEGDLIKIYIYHYYYEVFYAGIRRLYDNSIEDFFILYILKITKIGSKCVNSPYKINKMIDGAISGYLLSDDGSKLQCSFLPNSLKF